MKNNRDIVANVYRDHNDWLMKVANNFTSNKFDSEDLVQSVYEYLLNMKNIEKIKYGNSVNTLYLYTMIKTRYLASKQKVVEIDPNIVDISESEYDELADQEFERINKIVQTELYTTASSLTFFDRRLYTIYFDEDHSMTSLANATKISRSTIWTSINKTRNHIKNKVYGDMYS